MSNHSLTNLANLSIEREYTESLDVEEIIKDFAIRKVRRINTSCSVLFIVSLYILQSNVLSYIWGGGAKYPNIHMFGGAKYPNIHMFGGLNIQIFISLGV